MLELPRRYLPERAPASPRRYRVEVTGCSTWTVCVQGRRCLVWPSAAGAVSAELRVDPASWLDLVSGCRHGLELFFLGLLQVKGDLNEAVRLETLFAPPAGSPGALGHAEIVRYRFGRHTLETFQAGDPDAPVALFLHGLGASKTSLLPALAGLADTHRVIALDFPGFGKSSAPVGARYDAPWLARAALTTLDAAGAERAMVVGNSMGGRVALELALDHPDRVSALGLLCPAVAFDEYHRIRPLLNLTRLDQAVGAAPWPVHNRMVKRMVNQGLRLMFADPDRVPFANMDSAADEFLRTLGDPRRRMALMAAARRIGMEVPKSFWRRLGGLQVPSLWIFGDTDRLVSAAYAPLARRHVPGATVQVWPECGHVPQFEYPVRTNETLTDYFSSVA